MVSIFKILDEKTHHKPNINYRSHKGKNSVFDHMISFTFILTNCIMKKGKKQIKAQGIYAHYIKQTKMLSS